MTKRLVPEGDPRFSFLEFGDGSYTPTVPIRVTREGVFAKFRNGIRHLQNVTVRDVEELCNDRSTKLQQYDVVLLGLEGFEKNPRFKG